MNSRDWQILQAIYKERNITKAAQSLFISQPAVTYRIKQLEKELGTKLILTDDKMIQFTTEGEMLVEYSKNMLLQEQKIKDDILNTDTEVRGTLRLAVSNSFAHYKMPRVLRSFLEKYPKVKIMMKAGISNDVMNMLLSNEVHLGIENIGFPWDGPRLSVSKDKIVVISKNKLTLEDLPNTSMIKYTKNPYLKNLIDSWWQKNFTVPPLVNIEVNSGETCKEMIKNCLGFAIVPESIITENDNLHTIELLDEHGKFLERDTWVSFRKSSAEICVVRKFIDFAFYENI